MIYYGNQPIGFISKGTQPIRVLSVGSKTIYPAGFSGLSFGTISGVGAAGTKWAWVTYSSASFSSRYVPYIFEGVNTGVVNDNNRVMAPYIHPASDNNHNTKWYSMLPGAFNVYITIRVTNVGPTSAAFNPEWAIFSTKVFSQGLCPVYAQGTGGNTLVPGNATVTYRFKMPIPSIPSVDYRFVPCAFAGAAYIQVDALTVHIGK